MAKKSKKSIKQKHFEQFYKGLQEKQKERKDTSIPGSVVGYFFDDQISKKVKTRSEARGISGTVKSWGAKVPKEQTGEKYRIEYTLASEPKEPELKSAYRKGKTLRESDKKAFGRLGTAMNKLSKPPSFTFRKSRVGKARRKWGSVPNMYGTKGRNLLRY